MFLAQATERFFANMKRRDFLFTVPALPLTAQAGLMIETPFQLAPFSCNSSLMNS
jgi:hypothetical protein